jgi:hypothetical protein
MVWKKIGEAGVDSGQLLICDPCYIDSHWKEEEYTGKGNKKAKNAFSYKACCNQTVEGKGYGELGILGTVFSTAFGDGCYEIFGNFKKVDGCKRITEVKIILV